MPATSGTDGFFWVFAYGSLMWRPGFDYIDCAPATVRGYHRSLCIFSHVHRGTPDRPGLVLGLDRGGACRGVAFRVANAKRDATIAYLRERELVTSVYKEVTLASRVARQGTVAALAYVADRAHPQYAGRLPMEEIVRLVSTASGVYGDNPDYIYNTHDHLLQQGVRDAGLAAVASALDAGSGRRCTNEG